VKSDVEDVEPAEPALVDDIDTDEIDSEIDTDTDDADGVVADESNEPGFFGGRVPQLLLALAVALVVATAAVAVWFGVSWLKARNDDGLAYSGARDEVNRVAQAAVVTMNTLDYRKVDQGLKDWETATTGALHDEVLNLKDQSKQTIVSAESITKATVLSSAVKELDDRAGKAVVLVAIKVNVRTKGAEPADKFQRIEGSLQRTDAGWKLDGIAQVPYTQPGQ
jgi:Mce-associated membrane protein